MSNGTEHPGESVLAGYADGELTESERTAVEAHLDECNACRAALADVARLLDAVPDQPATVHRRTIRRRWWLAPAVLAASIAVVLFQRAQPDRAEDIPRVNASEDLSSLQVVTPAENEAVSADRAHLSWRATEAAQYHVYVLSADGDVVWSAISTDTTVTIPPGRLQPAQRYTWYVDAVANRVIATTHIHHFQTTP